MQGYRSSLPNLDSLIAFEAAARLSSFKKAGDELGRTQSAVSHRIKLLETQLNVTLFERRHRSIQLTARGNELYSSVVLALNHLLAATDSITSERPTKRLRLWTDVAFSSFWLVPRLPGFFEFAPDVALVHTTTDVADDGFGQEIDAAIVLGRGEWPGYQTTFLFEEKVFPVCSPGYLRKHPSLTTLDALAQADLIDLSYEKSPWLNWTIWFAEKKLARSGARRIFESNSYEAVIAAARSDVGVAMGWSYMLDSELLNRKLLVPFPESIETGDAYYLICPNNRAEDPAIKLLVDWLRLEVDQQKIGFPAISSFCP